MRERLIGATVLVVIAVIVIPWLVSRAHHPREIVTHQSWPASASTPQQPYVLPLSGSSQDARRAVDGDVAAATPATSATHVVAAGHAPQLRNKVAAPTGLQPATHAAPPVAKPALLKGWSIQAASFADIKSARDLAKKLEQAGFKASLTSNRVKGTLYYQVRVGPYPSERRAREAAPGVARISNTQVLVRAPEAGQG